MCLLWEVLQYLNDIMIKSNYFKKIINRKSPYLIAEIGINHNGDLNLAKRMIVSAKKNGADCVKFQLFKSNEYISVYADKAGYQKKYKNFKNLSQFEIIKKCELKFRDIVKLKSFCRKIKIDFLCTPFEISSLKELAQLKVKAIKISSCNLTNTIFLKEVLKTKLPVILSTGMANIQEVKRAVKIFKNKTDLIILQCTSNYPSKIENSNLNVLDTYKKTFKTPVGFSDHTEGNLAASIATAKGAILIEKHFTLSKKLPGIDQKASIEPKEMYYLKKNLLDTKKILGSNYKTLSNEENQTIKSLRRSLVASKRLFKGSRIDKRDIMIKRPGTGLSPSQIDKIVGLKLIKSKRKDEIFKMKDFEK